MKGLGALAPFADWSVEPQPGRGDFERWLKQSSGWDAYVQQASGGGEGRLNPADKDPRLWLPHMLSPALGNPGGNTLREFHYQSRCMRMIRAREAVSPLVTSAASRKGARRRYGWVLFTRLEMEWLVPCAQ